MYKNIKMYKNIYKIYKNNMYKMYKNVYKNTEILCYVVFITI